MMQGQKADGFEKEDHSSIVKYYEKVPNTTVESCQSRKKVFGVHIKSVTQRLFRIIKVRIFIRE